MSAPRALVTGGAGFIGSHLVARLQRDGADVHVIARPGGNTDRIAGVIDPHRILLADLRDVEALGRVFARVQPETVFHLAADPRARYLAGGDQTAERVIREHFDSTVSVARHALASGCRALVRTGSIEEYGDGPTPASEAQRERPVSPYSVSHVAVTHYLELLQQEHPDVSIVTMRPALTYGPSQSNDFFLPALIGSCLRGEDFAMSDGRQRRDFVYVDDIVDALLRAAVRRPTPGGIINAGGGATRTIREVAELVHRMTGARSKILFGARPRRAADPDELYLAIDAAWKTLEWRPTVDLERGLSLTIDWYRRQEQR